MRSEAPVPTVGQVVAVVDAQLGSGLLRCLEPGCGGRLARWRFGLERDLVGVGGGSGRVRPPRAACAAGGGVRGVAGAAARFDAAAQAVRGGGELGGVAGGGAGTAVEPGRGGAGGAVYDGAGVAAPVRPAGGPGARVAVRAAAPAGG